LERFEASLEARAHRSGLFSKEIGNIEVHRTLVPVLVCDLHLVVGPTFLIKERLAFQEPRAEMSGEIAMLSRDAITFVFSATNNNGGFNRTAITAGKFYWSGEKRRTIHDQEKAEQT